MAGKGISINENMAMRLSSYSITREQSARLISARWVRDAGHRSVLPFPERIAPRAREAVNWAAWSSQNLLITPRSPRRDPESYPRPWYRRHVASCG
jgi:hypothetical protein